MKTAKQSRPTRSFDKFCVRLFWRFFLFKWKEKKTKVNDL